MSLERPARLRRSTLLLLGTFVLLTGLGGRDARAGFSFISRSSTYNISYSQSDFSDAVASYTTVVKGYSSTSGETTPLQVFPQTGAQGFSWTGGNGFAISNLNTSGIPAGNGATATLTSTATSSSSPGLYTVSYNTPIAADFNTSWIVSVLSNGQKSLEFQGGGSGLVDNSGSFNLTVNINGNWSSIGTGSGQTNYLGINPAWTVDSLFTYNSLANQTTFAAHINNYSGNDPNLDFILVGPAAAAVPEPSSAVTLLLGFAALFTVDRLRRRRLATAG